MWRQAAKAYLLLLPTLLVLGGLFLGGLASAARESLRPAIGADSGLTLLYYRSVLRSPEFWADFALSLRIALLAMVLACAAGLALAARLATGRQRWAVYAARLPLAVPHIVAAYLAMLWLSQSGLLARLGYHLGLVAQPQSFPPLVNDTAGVGVIVTYVLKEAPFAALMLQPALAAAGGGLLDAAATLGASPLQRWRRVVLPLVAPALGAVALIIFAYTFGAYEVPYLLGRTYPQALPVAAMTRWSSPDLTDRPVAMVYNMAITVITGLAAWLYLSRFASRLERRRQ